MFKKVTKKRPVKRPQHQEDDEEGDDEDLSKIQQAKKRRQLLDSVQYKRGVNAERLTQQAQKTTDQDAPKQQQQEKKSDGVLEQKHRQAMEEYIQQQTSQTQPPTTNHPEDEQDKMTTKKQTATTAQDELFAQLAESSRRLTGQKAAVDADVGAGGALVAGTGICQVELPLEQRLKTVQETVQATHDRRQSPGKLPTTTAPSQQGLPPRFAVPRKYNAEHAQMFGEVETAGKAGSSASAAADTTEPADDERAGFAAFRQQQQSSDRKTTTRPQQRSSDDRAFKQFVTKQRERRQNR